MKQLIYMFACLLTATAVFPDPAVGQAPPGTDIYIAPISVEHGSLVVGRPRNVTARAGYDNQPFFSFDGTFFLFTSADSSGSTDIYRYDIEIGAVTPVTKTPESEYSPTPIKGTQGFSTVRVEADGRQRLWQFDLDGNNPRLVLIAVDSVGYHTWVDENTLGLFVLGEPHTLRLADVKKDADRVVASDIGRCISFVPGSGEINFVQIVDENESWITGFDPDSGETRRLVTTLPQSQDYAWIAGEDLLMADGSVLFLWAGDDDWEEVAAFGSDGLTHITRLAVSANGQWLALVADDS